MAANISSESCHFILDLSFFQGNVNTRVYDKRGNLSFSIVNSPFLDDDVPLVSSYYVCISQFVFALICYNVSDFNDRNLLITEKYLHQ